MPETNPLARVALACVPPLTDWVNRILEGDDPVRYARTIVEYYDAFVQGIRDAETKDAERAIRQLRYQHRRLLKKAPKVYSIRLHEEIERAEGLLGLWGMTEVGACIIHLRKSFVTAPTN